MVELDGRVARQRPDEVEDGGLGVVEIGQDHVGDHQRAGVDERVARDAVLPFKLDQRVEGIARGFPVEAFPEAVTGQLHGEGEREELGDALDREGCRGVAGGEGTATGGRNGDTEVVGRDAGEFRDIGGHAARPKLRPNVGDDAFDDRLVVRLGRLVHVAIVVRPASLEIAAGEGPVLEPYARSTVAPGFSSSKASWRARTASATRSRWTRQVSRISEVEIRSILIPASKSARNMREA